MTRYRFPTLEHVIDTFLRPVLADQAGDYDLQVIAHHVTRYDVVRDTEGRILDDGYDLLPQFDPDGEAFDVDAFWQVVTSHPAQGPGGSPVA